MKISIIIPVYKVEDYIADCLRSVFAQNYKGEIECILVDDCGNDDSMQIAEQLIDQYKGAIKFVLLHHDHNRGLSAARNTGITDATGEYVYFLDSDDTITEDCITSLCDMVQKYPGVDCVFAGANVSKQNYFTWMDYTKKELPEYSNNKKWLQESMLERRKLSMTAWNKLVNIDFLKINHLYFEEGFIHEDEIWNLLVSQYISSAAFLKKNTYNYVVRDNSIITTASSANELYLQRHFRLWIKMLDLIKAPNPSAQSYCVFLFTQIAYTKIKSFSEWKELLRISIRAFIIARGKKKVLIFAKFINWNIINFLIRPLKD